MPYVTSTATASTDFTWYEDSAGGEKIPARTITIQGGANVATKHFVTPEGVMTEVSEEELELLEAHKIFQQMKDNGFLKVHKRDRKLNVKDMEKRDISAPFTPQDYKTAGREPPKTEAY